MNLNDPRNVILTVPQGFQFSLDEYQNKIGCRLKILELPVSDTDTIIKDVIAYGEKNHIKIRVKSWSPLLFEKVMKNFDGEPITENFSILALRIVGDLNDLNGEVEQSGRLRMLNLPDDKKH